MHLKYYFHSHLIYLLAFWEIFYGKYRYFVTLKKGSVRNHDTLRLDPTRSVVELRYFKKPDPLILALCLIFSCLYGSLARCVLKPLKVPSPARSVPKPLKVPSLARSVPKPLSIFFVDLLPSWLWSEVKVKSESEKWKSEVIRFWSFIFREKNIRYRRYFNLYFYVSKKVHKNFFMGLKIWWSWGSEFFFQNHSR